MALLDFDKISTESYIGSTLSMEDIDPQLNDKEIEKVRNILVKIQDKFLNDEEDYTNLDLMSDQANYIKDMESILSNRFGIRFKIVFNDDFEFASYTSGPKHNSALFFGRDIYKSYKDYLDFLEQKIPYEVRGHDYKELYSNKDVKAMYEDAIASFDAVEEAYYNKGIVVDFKQAKIKGLNKDVQNLFSFDFHFAFAISKMTVDEFLACILHEIGHMFSYYSTSYKSYVSYVSLQDALKEISKKESDPKKALLLAYNKTTNDTTFVKENEKSDLCTITLGVINKILGRFDRDETVGGYTSKETYADLFSTRFGYGNHLATGLDKLEKFGSNGLISLIKTYSVGLFTAIIFDLFSSLILGFIFPAITVSLLFLSILALIKAVSSWTYKKVTSFGKVELPRYESPYRRLQYIRNQMVYLLRNSNRKDKRLVEELNKALKEVEEVMGRTVEHNGVVSGIWSSIKRIFSPGFRADREKINLHYELEKLIYNDVHVANSNLNEYLLKNKG